MHGDSTRDPADEVDPLEFVRAILNVSPEDAAKVRRQAAGKGTKADKGEPQEGPHHDFGEDD